LVTCYSPVRHSVTAVQAPLLLVRLACVKHAASVRPEPGSNSPLFKESSKSSDRTRPHYVRDRFVRNLRWYPLALEVRTRRDVVLTGDGPAHSLETPIFNQRWFCKRSADRRHGEQNAAAVRPVPARCEALRVALAPGGVNSSRTQLEPQRTSPLQGERPDLNRRPPGPQPGALTA
jgi:hypothetical protein